MRALLLVSAALVFAPRQGAYWSPYLVGALLGLLLTAAAAISRKALGASTAYARIAGMLGASISAPHTKALPYYEKKKPKIDWEVMLVLGIVPGALLGAVVGGSDPPSLVPPLWEARFGASPALRAAAAAAGGIFMAFGARVAGGCTSGHGISGTSQLAAGSWAALLCFFLGGAAGAWALYYL